MELRWISSLAWPEFVLSPYLAIHNQTLLYIMLPIIRQKTDIILAIIVVFLKDLNTL
jgi:hypothetical protein